MTLTDFWSPALALPAYLDDEPPLCLSTLYTPAGGLRTGPLVCIFDAGHPISGGPNSLHVGGSLEHPASWSDADAARSLMEYRVSAKSTGPLCSDCDEFPQFIGGRCQGCTAVELAADDREEVEAA